MRRLFPSLAKTTSSPREGHAYPADAEVFQEQETLLLSMFRELQPDHQQAILDIMVDVHIMSRKTGS